MHTNLRLLDRKSEEYKGKTKMWDIDGDALESFENVGILEAEPLSLDEPNLETALFIDDGDMVKEETTLILL